MDIVYVTYNSSKWIDKCFESVRNLNYDLKKLFIYVVDNNSQDDTLDKLNTQKNIFKDAVGCFEIVRLEKNLGFGGANNIGFARGNDNIVCFFNIDTELEPDSLIRLEEKIEEDRRCDVKVKVWELRQFPYEHPKYYDPITMYTSWCSGAAFAVERDVFNMVKGFDDQLFMYAEDVDLSWRIRSYGYQLKYVPKAIIYHYSYEDAGVVKPNQYINGIINNIMLRYRYGDWCEIIIGYLGTIKNLIRPEVYKGARKQLFREFIKHFSQIGKFKHSRALGNCAKSVASFKKFDYSPMRDGAYYYNEICADSPKVAILIQKNEINNMEATIKSIENQTYDNIDILTEDEAKTGVNAKYIMKLVAGDILFADCVEVCVAFYEKNVGINDLNDANGIIIDTDIVPKQLIYMKVD